MLVLTAAPAQAAVPLPHARTLTSSTGAQTFADELYAEGDWFRAIGEYRREIFAAQNRRDRARLWLLIGDAYARARRYGDAARVFMALKKDAAASDLAGHCCWRLALAWLDSGLGPITRTQIATCRKDPQTVAIVGLDRLELAVAAAWMEERSHDQVLTQLRGFERRHNASKVKSAAAALRKRAREATSLATYSPLGAGVLSAIVPGLGQFYQGRYWDGTQSLVIVGLLGLTSVGLFRSQLREEDGQWLLPIATGTVTSVFYAANIYGAANGARMNTMLEQVRFIEKVRREWRPALEVPLPARRPRKPAPES